MNNHNVNTNDSRFKTTNALNANASIYSDFLGYQAEVIPTDGLRDLKVKFTEHSPNTNLFSRKSFVSGSGEDTTEEALKERMEKPKTSSVTEQLQETTEVEELKQQIEQLNEEHAAEIEQLKKQLREEKELRASYESQLNCIVAIKRFETVQTKGSRV